jgi:hypothetical protein
MGGHSGLPFVIGLDKMGFSCEDSDGPDCERKEERERERRGTAYYKVVWWHG